MKTIRFLISIYNALKINWCSYAAIPSSRLLGDKIIEGIDLKKVNYILKYGLSTGVFAEKLIKRINLKTIILLMENNKEFYFFTKNKI
ncbi:ribose ABC transporter ATP-binding protein [Bacillus cereus]|uniref:ribose ABC transporter ATP-binding protein n=1 Tax=Bacillus cereus TaxID=1396 RepID=UPI003637B35E